MDIQQYIGSGIVESYVLGLASAEEIAELESLRPQYPELDVAIKAFELNIEEQGLRTALQPPPSVKANLMEMLKDEFRPAAQQESPAIIRSIHPAWKTAAAASVILFLVSGIAALLFYNKYNKLSADYAALQTNYSELEKQTEAEKQKYNTLYADIQLIQDTSVMIVKMKGVAGKENSFATVYWNTRTSDVYLHPNLLPKPAAGKQYQLWAIIDGKPVDAGLIGSCTNICKLKNIRSAQAFAITLEKEGGSATPTLSEMYVLGTV
ncbi:MAG TPA: anti-sigma factor [Chitinophagaceae bacterium]|nr:anti-sigma factor [Chitinophagaceae bacterium]